MDDIAEEKLDAELRGFLIQMARLWKQGDERLRQALLEFVKGYLGEEEE
jgi:hypothetical protein